MLKHDTGYHFNIQLSPYQNSNYYNNGCYGLETDSLSNTSTFIEMKSHDNDGIQLHPG